jgi:AhpD family alkylhydroperoxidase
MSEKIKTASEKGKPSFYKKVAKQFPEVIGAVENLGTTLRTAGPLDEKTSQLIQMAAAAAEKSEGAVISHARRAMQAGATAEEINHALLLLVSTIGFPQTMAAMSWVQNVLEKKTKTK